LLCFATARGEERKKGFKLLFKNRMSSLIDAYSFISESTKIAPVADHKEDGGKLLRIFATRNIYLYRPDLMKSSVIGSEWFT